MNGRKHDPPKPGVREDKKNQTEALIRLDRALHRKWHRGWWNLAIVVSVFVPCCGAAFAGVTCAACTAGYASELVGKHRLGVLVTAPVLSESLFAAIDRNIRAFIAPAAWICAVLLVAVGLINMREQEAFYCFWLLTPAALLTALSFFRMFARIGFYLAIENELTGVVFKSLGLAVLTMMGLTGTAMFFSIFVKIAANSLEIEVPPIVTLSIVAYSVSGALYLAAQGMSRKIVSRLERVVSHGDPTAIASVRDH